MKAGLDFGTSLVKAVWKKDEQYVFSSTKDTPLDMIVEEMKHAGVNEIHVEGIGYEKGNMLREGFSVKNSDDLLVGERMMSEIITQAHGARELLRLDGVTLDNFLLVGMGTGTSYAFVDKESVAKYPLGNSIGGGFMQGLRKLFGVQKHHEFVMRVSTGTPLDILIKDILPEKAGTFEGDLVIANFGKAGAGDVLSMSLDELSGGNKKTLNNICASIVHCVAVTTIRDVMFSSLFVNYVNENRIIPKDVVYVGSTIAYNPVLKKMLDEYTQKIGRTPHFPSNGAFALAMGAYLRSDSDQKKKEEQK